MKPSHRTPLEVRATKPKVVHLNKRSIFILTAITLTVLILIVVNAYTPSKRASEETQSASGGPTFQVAKTAEKPNETPIDALPSGYQNAALIDSMLKRNQQPKVIDNIPANVKTELELLQEQQQELLGEVNALKKNQGPQPKVYSSLDKEAMTSSIFFAGGAPQPLQTRNVIAGPNPEDTKKAQSAGSSGGDNGDSYASQNMQKEKLDFLNAKPSKDIYNPNAVQYPASKYILQAGATIPAILSSQIVSSLPGMITAVVSRDVFDSIAGRYLLIPKGSRLIGEYNSQISYGQTELQAKFLRLIRPDGTSVVLPEGTPGVDQLGMTGFSDTVDNHWGAVVGAAALMTVFNIPAVIATNQMTNSYVPYPGGGGYYPAPVGNTAMASSMQALGQSASQVGGQIASKSLNIQPTITIHPGYEFSVMVTRDTILPPYQTPMETIPESN